MSTTRAAKLALRAIRTARTHLSRAACTSDATLSRRVTAANQELQHTLEWVARLAVDLGERQAKARKKAP